MPATSSTPWVEGLTIGQVLAQTATRYPGNDALVFPALVFPAVSGAGSSLSEQPKTSAKTNRERADMNDLRASRGKIYR